MLHSHGRAHSVSTFRSRHAERTRDPAVQQWPQQRRVGRRSGQHSPVSMSQSTGSSRSSHTQPSSSRRHSTGLRLFNDDSEDWENVSETGKWAEDESTGLSQEQTLVAVGVALTVAAGVGIALAAAANAAGVDISPGNLLALAQHERPADLLRLAVTTIQDQGRLGYVYFGLLYVVAEVLAIPAIPLTASSGYLFGLAGGCSVVLVSATIAAAISFMLGRSFLRKWVEGKLGDNARFKALDKAIAKEGFKIILLLRLSPIFPFALSNYLYGLTSVDFWQFLGASMLGFTPGTIAYVYGGGQVGTILGGTATLPWYAYAIGAAFALGSIKYVGDLATKAVAEIEPGISSDSDI